MKGETEWTGTLRRLSERYPFILLNLVKVQSICKKQLDLLTAFVIVTKVYQELPHVACGKVLLCMHSSVLSLNVAEF